MACDLHGLDIITRRQTVLGVAKPVALPAVTLEATKDIAKVAAAPATYGATADFAGPMTPAQLAQLDRKLTPAEQAAVDAGQAKEAEDLAKAEEAKGGPKAKIMKADEHGATIVADPKPWWPWLVGAGGAVIVLGTVLSLAMRRKK